MALDAINDKDAKQTIQAKIKDMPLHEWDKATIFDTIEQFIVDNGCTPTPLDFKYSGALPQGATIQYRMKVTLYEFLNKYYLKKSNTQTYYNKTKEE